MKHLAAAISTYVMLSCLQPTVFWRGIHPESWDSVEFCPGKTERKAFISCHYGKPRIFFFFFQLIILIIFTYLHAQFFLPFLFDISCFWHFGLISVQSGWNLGPPPPPRSAQQRKAIVALHMPLEIMVFRAQRCCCHVVSKRPLSHYN